MILKCPFYYDLEEKFLSRAGIKPTLTSKELFGGEEDEEDFSDVEGLGEPEDEDNAVGKSARKRRKKTKKKSSPSASNEHAGDELEHSLSLLIQDHLKRKKENDKKEKDNGSQIAALAANFKLTADALGSRVQAAAAYGKFKMFLNSEEINELEDLQAGTVASSEASEND